MRQGIAFPFTFLLSSPHRVCSPHHFVVRAPLSLQSPSHNSSVINSPTKSLLAPLALSEATQRFSFKPLVMFAVGTEEPTPMDGCSLRKW